MKNIHFLEKILNDTNEYWVVAKENYYRQYFEMKRDKDDILLICLPREIKRPSELGEVKFSEVQKLQSTYISNNIFLTSNYYPPFQYGITLDSFWDGFPILGEVNFKDFLLKALQLDSNDLSDYKKLAEELSSK